MTVLAIELNDAGVLAGTPKTVADASPGFARVSGSETELGQSARKSARRYPHQSHAEFWSQLSQENIGSGTHITHADLAYAHLQSVYAPFRDQAEQVVLAVPNVYSRTQLGLLLGICQRASIPVAGVVDAALAGISHPVPGDYMVHADITLHTGLLTHLRVSNGLKREHSDRLDQIGMLDCDRRWAQHVGDEFVQQTRFDPMHSATAEQWLHDQLDGVKAQFLAGEELVELNHETAGVSAKISRNSFVAAAAACYQPLLSALSAAANPASPVTVLLSARLAGQPGFKEQLEQRKGVRVVVQSADNVVRAIVSDPTPYLSVGSSFALITERPWQASPSLVPPPVDGVNQIIHATHALVGSDAYTLSGEPFVLGTELPSGVWGYTVAGLTKGVSRQHCHLLLDSGQVMLRDTSTFGTWVNGDRVKNEKIVHPGDTVRLGNPGIEVQLIRQVSDDG